ncbi:HVA22-like protein h [Platanthera zijinensis]|uniref:HVA22-like protein h n=1 Tax=Platanthera zijinensis TaxID=2320716 RepID=A0AAP0FZU0_9ASPA
MQHTRNRYRSPTVAVFLYTIMVFERYHMHDMVQYECCKPVIIKAEGTTYIYETFFRPYVASHETEIDRNLLELKVSAGDMIFLYCQKAAMC